MNDRELLRCLGASVGKESQARCVNQVMCSSFMPVFDGRDSLTAAFLKTCAPIVIACSLGTYRGIQGDTASVLATLTTRFLMQLLLGCLDHIRMISLVWVHLEKMDGMILGHHLAGSLEEEVACPGAEVEGLEGQVDLVARVGSVVEDSFRSLYIVLDSLW